MKYSVMCVDPPWSFSDRLEKMKKPVKRSAVSQYSTMSMVELCSMDVKELADPQGCVLALWVPSALLCNGIDLIQAWGFKLKQTFVWVKTKKKHAEMKCSDDALAFGMGRLFRSSHELALIGTSGKSVYTSLDNHSQRSVIMSPNTGHSQKPEKLQDCLDVMFPDANKIELFARRVRPGWVCLGDAIDGKDINVAIQDVLTV